MANLNPNQMLSMLKNSNPRTVVEQIIQQNYPNNPFMQNLLQLGQRGDINSIQQYAQQYFSQQGRDLNLEMQNLMNVIRSI